MDKLKLLGKINFVAKCISHLHSRVRNEVCTKCDCYCVVGVSVVCKCIEEGEMMWKRGGID